MYKCFRMIFVAVLSITLTVTLVLGIYIADVNTRSIGYNDALPVAYSDVTDDKTVIGFMGSEIRLNISTDNVIDITKRIYKNSAPTAVKAKSVLKNIIEMLVDLFVQTVSPGRQ